MPELPEVEIVRRGLTPHMEGRVIRSCQLERPDLRFPFHPDFVQSCEGQRVIALKRRGKYIIVELGNNRSVIWHLGMSGQVKIIPAAANPASPSAYQKVKHDHVLITMDNGAQIIFHDPRRFGFMQLITDGTHQDQPPFISMGPEPLSDQFDARILADALRHRQAPIKNALLDQTVVAGLGNIYVCEALFESGISPRRKACTVTGKRAAALAVNIQKTLTKALEAGGSSLKDYKHVDGSLGYFQNLMLVYGREGEPCPRCTNTQNEKAQPPKTSRIQRIVQAGRSTFFCPDCQR